MISLISISLGSLFINSPFLAYLYKGLPLYLRAEKKGGFWKDFPKKLFISFFTSSSEHLTSNSSMISPDTSSVVVDLPSFIST